MTNHALALRDEIAYEIYKTGRASKSIMSFENFCSNPAESVVVDGLKELAARVLSLSEMVKMKEKAEKYDSFMRDQREWFDAINEVIHLRTEVQKYKEKAEKYDDYKDIINEWDGMNEKAEKWDKWSNRYTEWQNVQEQLDLLMSNLWVREKCPVCDGEGGSPMGESMCDGCNGVAIMDRPATVEEVRELLTDIFNGNPWSKWQICNEGGYYSLRNLKSGATLFMSTETDTKEVL